MYKAASRKWPHQLMRLCQAAVALKTPKEDAQLNHADKLLSAVLHPEVAQRMTAEEMAGLQWLQEAAAVPLMECPVKIRQLQ